MKPKTEAQVRSAERTLAVGSWAIVAGAMLYSVLTVTPLVREHTPDGWGWTAPILPIVVDAAVVIVVKLDSIISRLGGHGGPWSVVLRWMTGLMTLALNVGDSALKGDKVGAGLHSVAPLLLIVTAEASLAYRRAITKALADIERSRAAEQRTREQAAERREQTARADREHDQQRREQAETAAREQAERVAREAREHEEKLERERLDRQDAERQAERDHTARLERERLDREERQAEADRQEQRRRETLEREERQQREEREHAERAGQQERERLEQVERERREQARREARERLQRQPREQRTPAAHERAAGGREQARRERREQPARLAPVNTEPPKMTEDEAREAVRVGLAAGATVRELADKTGWSVGWVGGRKREIESAGGVIDDGPPEELSA